MLITHAERPGANGETEVFEKMVIVEKKSMTLKMLTEASVAIDLLHSKVVKNRFDEPDQKVFVDYFNRYASDIIDTMGSWARSDPKNYEALRALTNKDKDGEQPNTD